MSSPIGPVPVGGDILAKGFPPGVTPTKLIDRSLNLLREDLPTPTAVLKASSLANNARWMKDFREAAGVELCPHGKTTMSPEMFRRQIADGAWGLTCATAHHLEVYRAAGINRVIFANQLIGRANLQMALRHLRDPTCEVYFIIDSEAGACALAEAGGELGLTRPIHVLIEIGAGGARTGARDLGQAISLGRYVGGLSQLALAGVETFEGVFGHAESGLEKADAMLSLAAAAARALDAEGLFSPEGDIVLTAGGSDFFDRVGHHFKSLMPGRPTRTVLRSGCYLAHDDLHYTAAFHRLKARDATARAAPGGLRPALEVWGHVQSLPEPGLALCSLGKRDISYDWALPKPLLWWRPGAGHARPSRLSPAYEVAALNDQHLFLRIPLGNDLEVGDMIGFGVSHPCTTFDKWRFIPIVDDDYYVVDCVSTAF